MALASGVPLGAFTWTPRQPVTGMPDGDERHPLVVVQVGVAHRRTIQHDGLVEQRAVAIRGRLAQLLEEIGQLAHMISVDLRQLEDALFTIAVMRRVVERAIEPALRIGAIGPVAAQLEGDDARGIGAEAGTCRSNISRDMLRKRCGMPGGAAGNSRTSPLMFCAQIWMRRSISRTLVR